MSCNRQFGSYFNTIHNIAMNTHHELWKFVCHHKLYRAQLRAELDAYCTRLYGLTRDELRYILDPKDIRGGGFS